MTLVLRSPGSKDRDEVDVRFDGVAAMNLHQSFEPLTIRAADADERARIIAAAAGDIYDPVRKPPLCLVLASSQPDGFVVCAHVWVETRPYDPSDIGGFRRIGPRENTRTLWSAGPTGDPEQPHRYTLHEAVPS